MSSCPRYARRIRSAFVVANPTDPLGHHDWTSPEYVDSWIKRDVLHDDVRRPFLRQLVEHLAVPRDRPARVLDVGAGYGVLTREVLEEFPEAQVVLHDVSSSMLEHARGRLAEFADRTNLVQADLRDPGWVAAVGAPFDAVVSSMAIHNVRHMEEIRQIYADIFGLLVPGGTFLNVDLISPEGPMATAAMRMSGPRGRLTSRSRTIDLFAQLGWLHEIGFSEAECLHRSRGVTVLAGFK